MTADPATCSFQFNPTGTAKFTSSCDIAKAMLAKSSVNYTSTDAPAGSPTHVTIAGTEIPVYDGTLKGDELKAAKAAYEKSVNDALMAAGYPIDAKANTTVAKASNFFDVFNAQNFKLVLLMTYLIVLVTMVYGPMAAALVEMFPTRIRYSGMSLPYHIGNGWFGGLLPATAFAISAQSGNIYAGLWYAIIVASITVVIGLIFVSNSGYRRSLFGDDPDHKLHQSGYRDAPPSKGW